MKAWFLRLLMKDVRAYGLDAAGREGTVYRIVWVVMMAVYATLIPLGFTAWFVHELGPWLALPACVALAAVITLRLQERKLRNAADRSDG